MESYVHGNRKPVEKNVDIPYITSCAKQFNRTVKRGYRFERTYINVGNVINACDHILLIKSTF